ncbi:iron sulfur protein [Streptomyces lincolnensis]|nr:iron sulfur protein [Streptomyces lincolnensis]
MEGDVSMASESLHPASAPSRRTVVAAVGATGLAITLNACGSDDGGSSGSAGSSGTVLGKTADIPEGGGKIFKEQGVVVTQPTAGEFKAFSSKCTHQGCAVTGIAKGVITCPCHQSEFSVSDGSVKKGPATQALPAEKITVSGDSIELA